VDTAEVVVQGAVKPDGTLEIHQPILLPAGPVEVRVKVAGQPKESTWVVLERIWAESKALGLKARSAEEIDAEINAMRDESEAEMQEIEEIQTGKVDPGNNQGAHLPR